MNKFDSEKKRALFDLRPFRSIGGGAGPLFNNRYKKNFKMSPSSIASTILVKERKKDL